MNLFELFVKIGVDDQASKNISNISSKLGNGLKKAAGIGLKAVTAASAGIAALTGAAVKNYAEYEQLVGGAELMFGKAFETVQKNAKEAYKTVQMSQNEYLQQVNGFATGLKTALGGNEQAAAELSHKIVQAEADIVAATGNTQENVANAFAGIMKSNFTMLDNLQIGITPTKEGFQEVIDKVNEWNKANGRATKYQMGNLADMQSALVDYIDMVGMSGYAQNEASKTISGSLASMKSAWSNLITGVADDSADFDELINNMVDSVATVGENIMPRVEKSLLGVSKLIEKLLPTIANKIPNILSKFAPKLLNSGFNILKQLVKGIKNNAKIIVNSAKDLILSFIDGMVDMFPDVIDAGIELLSGIVEAIPDVVANLAKNLPKISDAIIKGLGKAAGSIGKAIVGIFVPFDNEIEKASEKLSQIADAINPFMQAMEKSASNAKDLSNALSENGNTISELDDKIDEVEGKITEILKKEFKEQDGLRQKDLYKIKKYRDDLKELQEELLGIYQGEQGAIVTKSSSSIGELTAEQAGSLAGEAKAAFDESNKITEDFYNNEIIRIDNFYKARNEIDSDAHKDALKSAKKDYDERMKANKKYYSDAVKNVEKSSDKWLDATQKQWDNVKAARGEAEFALVGTELLAEKTGVLGKLVVGIAEGIGSFDGLVSNYANALSEIDAETTKSFLSMQAQVINSGGVIDEESRKNIDTILSAFEGLPEELDEEGREALDGLINGLEDQIPELNNASNMTTDEIIKVLRKKLVTDRPGQAIGAAITDGLIAGLKSKNAAIRSGVGAVANLVTSAAKKAFGIKSPSRLFKNEIGKQLVAGLALGISDYSYMAEDAMGEMSSDVANAFDTDTMVSTSTSSVSDFGGQSQTSEFSNPKSEVVISVDDSNAMGFARALLPLLKIAEKEVYA